MSGRRFAAALLALLALALLLRTIYPAADPPWRSTVGVVWHDEGAWTHNARNKALFGSWRQDEWNPVYIAPVFTALEYVSFEAFGVGVKQARLVSQLAGLVSVLLLALGVRRIAGPFPALLAAALAGSNYVYVMYDRAAIMEALMAGFIVAAWYCATRAEREPRWGALAGACATLAFFTKAAAAFFVAALFLAAVASAARRRTGEGRVPASSYWTLGGLAVSFGLIVAAFVLPHWTEYQFYNWQVSVTRKPAYDAAALLMRVSWFPILHDTFSRMWPALVLGLFGAWSIVLRWRESSDGERLLVLWLAVGTMELLVHDVGNERRFVFLIPGLIALASLVLARGSLLPAEACDVPRSRMRLALPVLLYAGYVVLAPLTRLPYLDRVHSHVLKMPVRLAAGGALLIAVVVAAAWPRAARLLSARAWGPRVAAAFAGAAVAWNVAQFSGWAVHRTYRNYDASRALGTILPPGTLVQGKLANGLALENGIRPLFIGHQFGNYPDRKDRWDVRYILTYTDPTLGFEGDQILEVLDAYPGWRTIMTFDVAETASGHDKAALIEKRARH
jgi:4-amino-4-deoxy-L-arabinose transferase-like glycosyltransferase